MTEKQVIGEARRSTLYELGKLNRVAPNSLNRMKKKVKRDPGEGSWNAKKRVHSVHKKK